MYEKKEETLENIDNLAFDKKLWNLGEIQQFPDLSLKKESESNDTNKNEEKIERQIYDDNNKKPVEDIFKELEKEEKQEKQEEKQEEQRRPVEYCLRAHAEPLYL